MSGPLLLAAVGITLVSLTDTIATATSFAARRGDEVDADQEMVGMGASNIAAGLFGGFAISTSGSRTAVAEQSGAKSQLTGVVGAGVVLLLLLAFPSLLADLPQTALAAVVIAAALSLMDFGVLRRYLRVRKSAVVLSVIATVGVVLFGVLQGILVAVILSILLFFRGAGGHTAKCSEGSTSSTAGTASSSFPDSGRGRWRRGVTAGKPRCSSRTRRSSWAGPRAGARARQPRWVVLQCEAITDVDLTAADMLRRLDDELNSQGVHLAFVELRSRLSDLVGRYGLDATLDRDHFYPTLEAALDDIASGDVNPSDDG